MRASLLAALLLAAALAGCTGSDAPAADGDSLVHRDHLDVQNSWALDAGELAEANLELRKGHVVSATWASDAAAVRWDVHGHDEAGNVQVYESGAGTNGTTPAFTAPADGTYSFSWQNGPSSPSTILEVRIQGEGKLLDWAP